MGPASPSEAAAARPSIDLAVGASVDLGPATVTLKSVAMGNVTDANGNFVGGTYFTFEETAHINGVPCYSLTDVYVLLRQTRQAPPTALATNVAECTELNAGETGYQAIGFPFATSDFAQVIGSAPLTLVLAPGGTPLARWDYYPQNQGSAVGASSSAPSAVNSASTSASSASAGPSSAVMTTPPAQRAAVGSDVRVRNTLKSAAAAERSFGDHNNNYTTSVEALRSSGFKPSPGVDLAAHLTQSGDFCLTATSLSTGETLYLSSLDYAVTAASCVGS